MPALPPRPRPPVTPEMIALALDLLHQAALAIAIPPAPRPDLETASAADLRAYVVNMEADIERRITQALRVDEELGRLRSENYDLRQQLAAKGGK